MMRIILALLTFTFSACGMTQEQSQALACLDRSGMVDHICNPNKDYDWDWDYQPGNRQFVCRGVQTGRYAQSEKCQYDIMDDDRWPS